VRYIHHIHMHSRLYSRKSGELHMIFTVSSQTK